MSDLPGPDYPGMASLPAYIVSATARQARLRKLVRRLTVILLITGVVSVLVGTGLIVHGSRFPPIPEKSATAQVAGEGQCYKTDCAYTVVFTDASGARVTASLVASASTNLPVGSTTTIYYEVANPTYTAIAPEGFENDPLSNLTALGFICGFLGFPITVLGLFGLFGARLARRRRGPHRATVRRYDQVGPAA